MSFERMGMYLVYDVAHNIAKLETYEIDGIKKTLCVHRKRATRAFPKGHPEIPERYRDTGQPVIIPGDMGSASYLLAGEAKSMDETFGSACHGAGRILSRRQASKNLKGRDLAKELALKDIYVMANDRRTLDEEAPEAYKDVDEVVRVVHEAGIARRVARMRPVAVVKG